MPEIPVMHSYTAVTKYGMTIVTVCATNETDARILANEEMKVEPYKQSFVLWARDGYRLQDNGPI